MEDVVHLDVTVVFDVLHLLPVPVGLLESLDDQGGGGGTDGNRGLSVLDGELDSDLETLPVPSGLGDVLSNLLGGETEGTDLGGEGRGGSDLTSDHAELDDLDLVGVKLGRHLGG